MFHRRARSKGREITIKVFNDFVHIEGDITDEQARRLRMVFLNETPKATGPVETRGGTA